MKSALVRRFACAVAEVDHHELWQRARLTLAIVGREAGETDDRLLAGRRASSTAGRGLPGGRRGARAASPCRATPADVRSWPAASATPGCGAWTRALRQVLAEAVQRELSDPRLGFVTITRVEATQDSREAKVWFSTLRPRDARGEPPGPRVGARPAAGARGGGAQARATRRSSPSTTTRPSRTRRGSQADRRGHP